MPSDASTNLIDHAGYGFTVKKKPSSHIYWTNRAALLFSPQCRPCRFLFSTARSSEVNWAHVAASSCHDLDIIGSKIELKNSYVDPIRISWYLPTLCRNCEFKPPCTMSFIAMQGTT
jgi:hypothetical protein